MKYYIVAMSLVLAACSSSSKSTSSMQKPAEAKATEASAAKSEAKTAAKTTSKEESSATQGGNENTVCTYGEIKREIKILKDADKCTVEYVKDGSTQEIASGSSQSGFCGEIADRVRNNLTTAGYKCE